MARNNRNNSNFQIAYFIAGSCHTPDGAYSILCDLKEKQEMALSQVESSRLRDRAKVLSATRLLSSEDEVIRLEAQADISEVEGFAEVTARNVLAAQSELEFIKLCMEKLEPHRLYSHLSLPEAHEASQREEWKLELIARAENYLLTTGTIPADHFVTMRMHPDFGNDIMPVIEKISTLIALPEGKKQLLHICAAKNFDLPKLLGVSDDIQPK
jgi:hypothetical protein